MADARDLKSLGGKLPCRFESGHRHQLRTKLNLGSFLFVRVILSPGLKLLSEPDRNHRLLPALATNLPLATLLNASPLGGKLPCQAQSPAIGTN